MNDIVFLEPNKLGSVPFGLKHLYVLESSTHLVKIGVTANYPARKRTLETQSGFFMTREAVTVPISNYSQFESLVHKHFSDDWELGEWFHAPFEAVTEYIKHIFSSLAEFEEPTHLDPASVQLFQLPTAMEEEKEENPLLYEWLIQNGFEEYWTEHSCELRVKGVDLDLPFEEFARFMCAVMRAEDYQLPPDDEDFDENG